MVKRTLRHRNKLLIAAAVGGVIAAVMWIVFQGTIVDRINEQTAIHVVQTAGIHNG